MRRLLDYIIDIVYMRCSHSYFFTLFLIFLFIVAICFCVSFLHICINIFLVVCHKACACKCTYKCAIRMQFLYSAYFSDFYTLLSALLWIREFELYRLGDMELKLCECVDCWLFTVRLCTESGKFQTDYY